MSFKVDFELPEWDEEAQRPKFKMPDCPHCLEDELGMINKKYVLCYNCRLQLFKTDQIWVPQE